jgi:hypothetical protein
MKIWRNRNPDIDEIMFNKIIGKYALKWINEYPYDFTF